MSSSIFEGLDYLLCYSRSGHSDSLDINLRIANRAVELGHWPSVKIFRSPLTACVVITHMDISAVKNPHVTEWAGTFVEVDEENV